MEHALALRPAAPDDDDVLLTWIPDAAALHLFTGDALRWPLTREQLRALDALPGRRSHALVATAAPGVPVGRVDVTVQGSRARLSRVVIAPEHRGRGWARDLVALALDAARSRGAERVGLNVVAGNTAAERTYASLGFVVDDAVAPRAGIVAMVRAV